MTWYWERKRSERGATMIEFAFVFPIFIALVFAIVELGVMFQKRTLIDDAVQAAGRVGAALGNDMDTDLSMLETITANAAQIGNDGVDVLR